MKNIKREKLRAMITNAIIMYDVEGTRCLANIPHRIHEDIIDSNSAIDNKVSSSESGYNDVQLQQYAINESNRILTAYDRTNRPVKEIRNAYLRKKYAENKTK
jgi:hypothetical protein